MVKKNMTLTTLRLGTRGSPLALRQAEMVKAAVQNAQPNLTIEIVPIKTAGDWRPEEGEHRLSAEAGGKGQFVKEIEAALLAGRIDAAVHSAKDVGTTLPDGLALGAYLPREDARDALIINKIANNDQKIWHLKDKAAVGTASVRRQAFLLRKRPDLTVTPLRGNVQTRLDKLAAGQADATLLAMAGLNRLGLAHHASKILEIGEFLPAAAQGAVCIEFFAGDKQTSSVFSQINHLQTMLCAECEREIVAMLDGSCHTPIGAHAVLHGNVMHIRTAIASLDGAQYYTEEDRAEVRTPEEATALGRRTGQRLKSKIPPALLSQRAEG